jgi:Ring finger domain
MPKMKNIFHFPTNSNTKKMTDNTSIAPVAPITTATHPTCAYVFTKGPRRGQICSRGIRTSGVRAPSPFCAQHDVQEHLRLRRHAAHPAPSLAPVISLGAEGTGASHLPSSLSSDEKERDSEIRHYTRAFAAPIHSSISNAHRIDLLERRLAALEDRLPPLRRPLAGLTRQTFNAFLPSSHILQYVPVEGEEIHNSDDCPICLQPYTSRNKVIFPCGHAFHWSCARRLERCPSCRQQF